MSWAEITKSAEEVPALRFTKIYQDLQLLVVVTLAFSGWAGDQGECPWNFCLPSILRALTRLCTSPITNALGTILYFAHRAVKSCSWLSPQRVWGTAQSLWYFPSEIRNQQVISWKLYLIRELSKLRTFNFYLLLFSPQIYRRSLILY